MKKSELFKLDWGDLLKGFIVAFLTAFITAVYQAIEAGTFELTWLFFKPITLVGLGGGLAYILKNWLTNSNDKFIKKEENE